MVESIGKRIAILRQKHGWTQQSLADRLAISRVAVSHIEMDLTIPSERSITLMAGLFKLSPPDLVEGTTYPKAKAERLPEITATYTQLEVDYMLLRNDVEWLSRLNGELSYPSTLHQVLERWYPCLESWSQICKDEHELAILDKMRKMVRQINSQPEDHLE